MTVPHARPIGAQHPRVRDLLTVRKDASPGRIMVEGSWEHDRLLTTNTTIEAFFWCPEASTPYAVRDQDQRGGGEAERLRLPYRQPGDGDQAVGAGLAGQPAV